jgi:hypothetical protein
MAHSFLGEFGAGTASQLISVTATVPGGMTFPAGSLVLVGVTHHQNSSTGNTVTDSKGNTYTRDHFQSQGTAHTVNAFSSRITTALVAGDTVTVTWSATRNGAINVSGYSGTLVGGTVLDQIAANSGLGTNTTTVGPTSTLAQADELVYAVASNAATRTLNWATPATDLTQYLSTTTIRSVNPAYGNVAATTAITGSGTWSNATGDYAAVLLTYKADAGGGTVTGSLSGSLSAPTASLAGDVVRTGALAASVSPPTAALTGNVVRTGALSASVSPPTAALSGTVTGVVTGALSATALIPTAALAGTYTAPITGALSTSVQAPTASLAGNVIRTGALSASVSPPTAALTGLVPRTGVLSASVSPPAAALSGTAGGVTSGTFAGPVSPPVAAFTGTTPRTGTLTATISPPVAQLSGNVITVGALSAAALVPSCALTGTVTIGTVTGVLQASVPLPILALNNEVNTHGYWRLRFRGRTVGRRRF